MGVPVEGVVEGVVEATAEDILEAMAEDMGAMVEVVVDKLQLRVTPSADILVAVEQDRPICQFLAPDHLGVKW